MTTIGVGFLARLDLLTAHGSSIMRDHTATELVIVATCESRGRNPPARTGPAEPGFCGAEAPVNLKRRCTVQYSLLY